MRSEPAHASGVYGELISYTRLFGEIICFQATQPYLREDLPFGSSPLRQREAPRYLR